MKRVDVDPHHAAGIVRRRRLGRCELGLSMNSLRIIFQALIVATISLPLLAEESRYLHFGPLELEFPSTWRFDDTKQPIEGQGPKNEKALITIMSQRKSTTSNIVPSAKETAHKFASGPMAQIAAKSGRRVIRPVREFVTAEGKAAYYSGSESSGFFFGGKSYFLQYLFSAPGTVIYVTLEGNGRAVSAMEQFDAIISTHKWSE